MNPEHLGMAYVWREHSPDVPPSGPDLHDSGTDKRAAVEKTTEGMAALCKLFELPVVEIADDFTRHVLGHIVHQLHAMFRFEVDLKHRSRTRP